MMGVQTALFRQEKKSYDARNSHFAGDTMESWCSLFFSFPSKGLQLTDYTGPFIELAFSDLATKRESAWMTGVETVLF